jgi:hypothetical protein
MANNIFFENYIVYESVKKNKMDCCVPTATMATQTRHNVRLYIATQRVSQELDYRIDICRVTKGAHIEHL